MRTDFAVWNVVSGFEGKHPSTSRIPLSAAQRFQACSDQPRLFYRVIHVDHGQLLCRTGASASTHTFLPSRLVRTLRCPTFLPLYLSQESAGAFQWPGSSWREAYIATTAASTGRSAVATAAVASTLHQMERWWESRVSLLTPQSRPPCNHQGVATHQQPRHPPPALHCSS